MATKEAVKEVVNKTKQRLTQEALDKQEKVTYTIPKQSGNPPEYIVNINGCKYVVTCGVPTKVPQQVADMLTERMESEGVLERKSASDVARLTAGGL